MQLNEQQQAIVELDEPFIAVEACAACGKTRVLTERVRKLLRDGIEPSDIAVITFTNMAAQELKDRLADDYKNGIYIGTIHGLANKFLTRHGIFTSKIIKDEEFDRFFDLLKKNPHCVRHIPYVLLDECQDTSPPQFEFIFNMINPKSFFVVGDFNQSIYSFRGAVPQLFKDLMEDPKVVTCSLNLNYRNASNILTFAKDILRRGKMLDTSISTRRGGLVYEGTPNIGNVVNWIKEEGHPSNWAMLCCTNDIIKANVEVLENNGIECVTFKQGDITKAQLDSLMKKDAVKVLTRHSAKGLEFPNVVVWEPQWWSKANNEFYRVNYVAATRAIDRLYWLEIQKKKRKYF